MSFNCLILFKPNEHKVDYNLNDETFLFEIGNQRYVYVGDKLVTTETNDKILNNFSELGYNVVKYVFANGE